MLNYKKLLFIALILSAFNTKAETLPVGISLNMSGSAGQYSLDFKNGIEAYFQTANKSGEFGKYTLELVAMDDMSRTDRVIANTKRLIKTKKVLAILTTYDQAKLNQIVDIAAKNKTLVLSANHPDIEISKSRKKYLAYLNHGLKAQLNTIKNALSVSEHIISVSANRNSQLTAIMSPMLMDKNSQTINSTVQVDANFLSNLPASTFIIDKPFYEAINDIKLILKANLEHQIYVLPNAGASLIANALKLDLTPNELQRVVYINTVPLHQNDLSIVKSFNENMEMFNPSARKSHQAFKGYVLAKLVAESIKRNLEGIKADSLVGVITLPFQVLDKVVGWVKHAGANLNKTIIADSLSNLNHFDIGLGKPVSIRKDKIIIDNIWLTRANLNGKFIEHK
jgi:uncharacterized protein YnzC (UPF0291/DUF896 family)